MALTDYKITSSDLTNKGVEGLADTPELSTSAIQEKFDEIAKDVIIPKHNSLVDSLNSDYATKNYVDQKVIDAGAGDMTKSVYDVDNDGIVDNSEKLGGNLPSYYAKAPVTYDKTLTVLGWAKTDSFTKTTTITGGEITLTAVTFKSKVSNTEGTYAFTYSGEHSAWYLSGAQVTLSEYGIAYTGTPADTNTIVIVYALALPYKQEVAISGLLTTDIVTVGPVFSSNIETVAAEQEAAALVTDCDKESGKLVFRCISDAPTTALNIQVEVTRNG